jgi:hypothetical protein
MSDIKITVERIDAVEPHPNADRLEVVGVQRTAQDKEGHIPRPRKQHLPVSGGLSKALPERETAMMTLQRIKNLVHRLDPELETTDEAYDVAVIMLAALEVGPNIRRIARFTQLTYRAVTEVSRRLRANGVWQGTKTVAGWAGKDGGLAFWLDDNVGLGYLEKT